ncbi:MAG TPA: hypothetical protein VH083_22500 [Myxococcales bacterium]|nr:hypothetical protein [Myxococcales bacterium]
MKRIGGDDLDLELLLQWSLSETLRLERELNRVRSARSDAESWAEAAEKRIADLENWAASLDERAKGTAAKIRANLASIEDVVQHVDAFIYRKKDL